jgi:sporulation protein YlmC with PRC-barrel domain
MNNILPVSIKKIIGSPVYNTDNNKIGRIYDLMLAKDEKKSKYEIVYLVLSHDDSSYTAIKTSTRFNSLELPYDAFNTNYEENNTKVIIDVKNKLLQTNIYNFKRSDFLSSQF